MGPEIRMIYYLGLGGNLDRPVRRLARARERIARMVGPIRKASSLYWTEPVGRKRQPWFVNQAIEVESALSPLEVLAAVQKIEANLGRVRGPRNGPRTLDIDILLAGKTVLRSRRLTLPHPRLPDRNFVLFPLAEIAPRRRHPLLGKTISALKRACSDRSIVMVIPKKSPGGERNLDALGKSEKLSGRRDCP